MPTQKPIQKHTQDLVDVIDIDDEEGYADLLSPISIREQRIARARGVLGFKQHHDRGVQADPGAAEGHRTTGVAKVLQLLHSQDDPALREALQRLHVNWYFCETERLQCLLRAAGAPAKACNLAPQVVQACQVCRDWQHLGNSDKLIYSPAATFNTEIQFDLMFYRSPAPAGTRRRKRCPDMLLDRLLYPLVGVHDGLVQEHVRLAKLHFNILGISVREHEGANVGWGNRDAG